MYKEKFDVVVCGGGIAGIAAALAAARQDVSVCLLEKEYALGGLATLGLIVVYLPLCDGDGVQMSSGISEELLKLSMKYGPGEIPEAWRNEKASLEERKKNRYRIRYNAASFMIAAEELLISHNVKLFYDARVTGTIRNSDSIEAVEFLTKSGKMTIEGRSFIDATGDADICWLAEEDVLDDDTNRRTGWYFLHNGKDVKLRGLTDPLYEDVPSTSRLYSGTNPYDITAQAVDGRKMIMADIEKLKKEDPEVYPLMIPLVPGFRMTRRLAGVFEFSADLHENVWFDDSIGMIGNWRLPGFRYSIPLRSIVGKRNRNLFAVGRCSCADKSGWDLTRVIPTCAVTGEAAGLGAACISKDKKMPDIENFQRLLSDNGVLLKEEYFSKREK